MKKDSGIKQNKNGTWSYRYVIFEGDTRHEHKGTKDEFGNVLKTKTAAIKARDASRKAVLSKRAAAPPPQRKLVKEVFKEYCDKGREGRAYTTKRKQDSLWENHLRERFGDRFVDDISVGEINDYLSELYYNDGLAFRYVESFLKMFYLIFGQAYSRDCLSIEKYNKLCVNKDTKIHMPKLKDEDDTDIVIFTCEELALLDDYFRGTNAETAYLIGKFCGLRINECFGLKWDHVDFAARTITVDRQMQYQNSLIKLVPPKTRNGKRTIPLCQALYSHLLEKWEAERANREQFAAVRAQKQRFIEDLDGSMIASPELINCLPDGTIQTVNSFKYPTREIREKLGVEFKYHYLRHTFGTRMAEFNTPQHLLCRIMGHGNIHVTQRYYLSITKNGEDIILENLDKL